MNEERKGGTPAPEGASEAPPPPTIHEAELASGPTGAVQYGAEIDQAAAVARRRTGGDVVVRGNDLRGNRAVARSIEEAVGPCVRADPHDTAGPQALPHFQPKLRPPEGHTFYEMPSRKARRKR